jgi:steroid delta-isomerase-like uncharacterized protein
MGTQENKAAMLRFIDEYQRGGDERALEAVIAPDVVDHTPLPGVPKGRAGVKAIFDMFRAAFPDFRADVLDQVAEGDKVVTYKTFSGSQRGEFMGIPPTGRHVRFNLIDIVRMRDGQVVEHWNVVDLASLMQQLGAIAS